jgi:hypothetical protein
LRIAPDLAPDVNAIRSIPLGRLRDRRNERGKVVSARIQRHIGSVEIAGQNPTAIVLISGF